MKKKTSLRGKTILLLTVSLAVLVVISTVISYLFYSNAIVSPANPGQDEELRKCFFIIFTCADVIAAILLVVVGTVFMDMYIIKPVKRLTNAIKSIEYGKAEEYDERDSKQSRLALKNLGIDSGDEIEELYRALQKFQVDTSEYLLDIRKGSWEEEHDTMTMLDNREKFEKRCKEVYPFVNSIYITSMNIVNLHIVNDRLGAEAGDSIMTKVAREMRRVSSDRIHTYRIVDDHFLMVLTGLSEEDSVAFVKKWVERVGRLNRGSDNFECRLAWGGAYGEGEMDVDDIYKHADTEMYCNVIVMKKELEAKN
ncbi:MAG: diguanylate cyclase [Lachnospiraceae bacterium]|nr:diguanylate cyclase [Lachnospiraceae bacterium]